jgi:spore coat polysaccharide biosynthesis protein SpsF (cytidylyltransferase family)
MRPSAPAALCRPDVRLTVDTPDDLAWVRRLYGALGGELSAPLADILSAADRLAPEGGRA